MCVDRTAARITGFHKLVAWRKRNTYHRLFSFLFFARKTNDVRYEKKQEPVRHTRGLGERVSPLTSNCAGDVRQSSGRVRTHTRAKGFSELMYISSLGIVAYYLLYALSSINSATNPSTNSTTSSSFFFFFKLPEALFGGTFHASLLRCSVVSRRKTTDCIQQSRTACNGVFFFQLQMTENVPAVRRASVDQNDALLVVLISSFRSSLMTHVPLPIRTFGRTRMAANRQRRHAIEARRTQGAGITEDKTKEEANGHHT